METKLQRQEPKEARTDTPNLTGIPAQMKMDFERRSGLSFDDVRVHYNSDKPAQLRALAYTQGTQVYVGPGQERHLPHELGHVIQQKTRNVRPTRYISGLPVNDQPQLEREADRMPVQRKPSPNAGGVVQCQPPLPFGEDSALFASAHIDKDGGKKLGSIYFRNGRIRLIHPFGPEVAERREAIRYLIHGTQEAQIKATMDMIKNYHRKNNNKAGSPLIPAQFTPPPNVQLVVLPSAATSVGAYARAFKLSESRLFEMYFTNGKLDGSHMSRGGVSDLQDYMTKPAAGPGQDPAAGSANNVGALFYVMKHAQAVAKTAKTLFSFHNTKAEILRHLKNVSLKASLINAVNVESGNYPGQTEQMQKYPQRMLDVLNSGGFDMVTQKAVDAALLISSDNVEKRFGGYISNYLVRATGIFHDLDLEVDVDN